MSLAIKTHLALLKGRAEPIKRKVTIPSGAPLPLQLIRNVVFWSFQCKNSNMEEKGLEMELPCHMDHPGPREELLL